MTSWSSKQVTTNTAVARCLPAIGEHVFVRDPDWGYPAFCECGASVRMMAHDEGEGNMAGEPITMDPVRVEDIPASNGLRESVYEPLVLSFVKSDMQAVELNLHGRKAKSTAGSVAKAARKHGAKCLTRGERLFLVRLPDTTVTEVQSNGSAA